MNASQVAETRILTTLRLNGNDLHHLCNMAKFDADYGNVLDTTASFDKAWLELQYNTWLDAHEELMDVQEGVEQAEPEIEVIATPEQMELLCRITAKEALVQDYVPKCGWLNQTMRGLHARCIAKDSLPGEPNEDETAPKGYHLATEAEIQNEYGFGGGGIGRKAKLIKAIAEASYGNGDAFIISDPYNVAFAFVDANYAAEARLIVDVLNTWS